MSIEMICAVVKEEFRMVWSEWSRFKFASRQSTIPILQPTYSATPQSTCSTPSQSASTPHLLSPHTLHPLTSTGLTPSPPQASYVPPPQASHPPFHRLRTLTDQQPLTLSLHSQHSLPPCPISMLLLHVKSKFSVHTCHIHTIHLTPMVTSVFALPNNTVLLIIKTETVRLKVTG